MPERLNAIRGGDMGGDEYRVLNMPRCSVYRTTALNIATGAGQAIPWDQCEYDTDSMTAVSATTGYFIKAKTPGVYLFIGWGVWAFNAASFRQLQFSKNGGAATYGNSIVQPSGGVATGQHISAYIPLNRDDYVTLVAGQATGGNVAWNGATGVGPVVTSMDNGLQACLVSTLG